MDSNQSENIDSLWQIAELAFEQLKIEEKITKTDNLTDNSCKHFINSDGFCNKCGAVIGNDISREGEWNNYKDDSGKFIKNTQRCDTYVDTNPYSKGGTLLPLNNKSLAYKLQIQQTFSHKQKTYWLVTTDIEHAATLLKIHDKCVIDTAKHYWHKYMESGKLTRASVRKGLIAACLFYSCMRHNSPIERPEILNAFSCDTKTLSKGEKVLFEILDSDNLTYINLQIEESNSFIRYCSLLKLPFYISTQCNDIYEKYKIALQAVTPKSAVGGIIAYVVKFKLKLKSPTKTIISATVDVCTPTLNKVIELVKNLEEK